jgi:hypothetical protein
LDATISSRSTLVADDVWDSATAGLTAVGSIGKLLVDNVDSPISDAGGSLTPEQEALLESIDDGLDELTAAINGVGELTHQTPDSSGEFTIHATFDYKDAINNPVNRTYSSQPTGMTAVVLEYPDGTDLLAGTLDETSTGNYSVVFEFPRSLTDTAAFTNLKGKSKELRVRATFPGGQKLLEVLTMHVR